MCQPPDHRHLKTVQELVTWRKCQHGDVPGHRCSAFAALQENPPGSFRSFLTFMVFLLMASSSSTLSTMSGWGLCRHRHLLCLCSPCWPLGKQKNAMTSNEKYLFIRRRGVPREAASEVIFWHRVQCIGLWLGQASSLQILGHYNRHCYYYYYNYNCYNRYYNYYCYNQ